MTADNADKRADEFSALLSNQNEADQTSVILEVVSDFFTDTSALLNSTNFTVSVEVSS